MISYHVRKIKKENFFFIKKQVNNKDIQIDHNARKVQINIKGNQRN